MNEGDLKNKLNDLELQAWTATPDGALDFVNRFACDYFGVEGEELVRDGWQNVLHPADVSSTLQNWTRALETEEPYDNEFRLLRAADRTYRWHRARAVPLKHLDGRIAGWSGTNTDIDEAKRQWEVKEAHLMRRQK